MDHSKINTDIKTNEKYPQRQAVNENVFSS